MIGHGKRVLVVLVVDDNGARQGTALVLEQAGFTVVQAYDVLHALREMHKRRFDAVVTDSQMPHLNGLNVLAKSREGWPGTPVIIMSETPRETSESATANGAYARIRKSSDPGILLRTLTLAVGNFVHASLP